jgi:transmembrane sensor
MNATTIWTRLRHVLGSYPTTAREWAVRVQSSDVTRRELLALDSWLKADPRNAEAYARVNKISHLGLMLRDYPEERSRLRGYSKLRESVAPYRPRNLAQWHWATAGGAAAFGAIAALSFLLAPAFFTSSIEYASGRGEQRQVALADGSRMLVNTESEVRVDFTGRERAIELARGEAFFEVAKDATRPFVVRTASAEVRAIGTKFTVRRLDSDTEVIVTEGRVQVRRDGKTTSSAAATQPVAVVPGHLARVGSTSQPVQVASIDAARATAWTVGNVEFEEATLAEVIRDVNRYAAREFLIDDPSLADIRLTGRFRLGDIESVKFALRDRFDIAATEDKGVIRLSRVR